MLPSRVIEYLHNRTTRLPVLIVLITVTVFLKASTFDFTLWDDDGNVFNNQYLQTVNLHNLLHFWTRPYFGMYIPVSYMAFAGLSVLSRHLNHGAAPTEFDTLMNPHVFHSANIVVHLCNVVLVYLILRRTVKSPVPAAYGSLLFALHPLQVESVAWISELRGLLGSFFGLAAMLVYLSDEIGKDTVRKQLNFPAIGLFALSLLSKPSGVMIPFILLLWNVSISKRDLRQTVVPLLPWFALSVGDVLLTQLAQPLVQVPRLPLGDRFVIAFDSMGFYIEKLFWPFGLAAEYGRTPARVFHFHLEYATLAVFAIAAVACFYFARRRQWVIIGALTFLTVLFPVSGLVPFGYQYHSTVADRYVYLAMLGPSLILACALREVSLLSKSKIALVATSSILVLAAFHSYQQLLTWKNTKTVFANVLTVNPHDWLPHNQVGVELLRHKEYPAAEHQFRTVMRCGHVDSGVWTNLGQAVQWQNRLPEAVQDFDHALALSPKCGLALYGRAQCEAIAGSTDLSVADYRAAIMYLPHSTFADDELAMELYSVHRYPEAVAAFVQTLQDHPNYLPAYFYFAMTYTKLGQPGLARDIANIALARDPSFSPVTPFLAEASAAARQSPKTELTDDDR